MVSLLLMLLFSLLLFLAKALLVVMLLVGEEGLLHARRVFLWHPLSVPSLHLTFVWYEQ